MRQNLSIVIHNLKSGGAERVASHLANGWVAEGRAVTLCTAVGPESDFFSVTPAVDRIILGGARDRRNIADAIVANVRRIIRLRRALRRSKTDTVISFLYSTNILVILASWGLGLSVIISERNDPLRQPIGWQWRLLRWATYRFADVVTANSTHAIDIMRAYVPAKKLVMVPNPLILPKGVTRRSDENKAILTLGRLAPHKRHRLLVEAVAKLGEFAADWHVEILGDGPERDELIALSNRLGVAERTRFSGKVVDTESYYRVSGIFVLPSLYEGLPNALLEAMAHGLPPVVSDSLPGALEYVEHGVTGLVFRSGDAEHLSQLLKHLIEDPALRWNLGNAARERVRELGIEHVLGIWEGLLEGEVCKSHRRLHKVGRPKTFSESNRKRTGL